MRISKKVREEAALICAIAASTPGEWYSTIEIGLGLADGDRRLLDSAHELAVLAFKQAYRNWPRLMVGNPVLDSEAEALIRTGWSPGDEP